MYPRTNPSRSPPKPVIKFTMISGPEEPEFSEEFWVSEAEAYQKIIPLKKTHPPRSRPTVWVLYGLVPLEHGARFFLDIGVGAKVVDKLRRLGLDVVTVEDSGLENKPIGAILDRAATLRRVLITRDDQFRELHEAGELHAGILLVQTGKGNYQELIRLCLLLEREQSRLTRS